MEHVLDASVILANLNGEAGGEQLPTFMVAGSISVVSYTEVVTKLLDAGATLELAAGAVAELDLPMVEVSAGIARRAAELRTVTRQYGLSLGDRICLATAEALRATAVTADRAWASVEIGVPIVLVR